MNEKKKKELNEKLFDKTRKSKGTDENIIFIHSKISKDS